MIEDGVVGILQDQGLYTVVNHSPFPLFQMRSVIVQGHDMNSRRHEIVRFLRLTFYNTNTKIVLAVLKRFRGHKTSFKYQIL